MLEQKQIDNASTAKLTNYSSILENPNSIYYYNPCFILCISRDIFLFKTGLLLLVNP